MLPATAYRLRSIAPGWPQYPQLHNGDHEDEDKESKGGRGGETKAKIGEGFVVYEQVQNVSGIARPARLRGHDHNLGEYLQTVHHDQNTYQCQRMPQQRQGYTPEPLPDAGPVHLGRIIHLFRDV